MKRFRIEDGEDGTARYVEVAVYRFDAKLVREFRELMKQAAIEVGHWGNTQPAPKAEPLVDREATREMLDDPITRDLVLRLEERRYELRQAACSEKRS